MTGNTGCNLTFLVVKFMLHLGLISCLLSHSFMNHMQHKQFFPILIETRGKYGSIKIRRARLPMQWQPPLPGTQGPPFFGILCFILFFGIFCFLLFLDFLFSFLTLFFLHLEQCMKHWDPLSPSSTPGCCSV